MANDRLRKGHVFNGPEGMGYQLKHDLTANDALTSYHFEALGGSPEPKPGEIVPDWLLEQLSPQEKA